MSANEPAIDAPEKHEIEGGAGLGAVILEQPGVEKNANLRGRPDGVPADGAMDVLPDALVQAIEEIVDRRLEARIAQWVASPESAETIDRLLGQRVRRAYAFHG